MEHDAPAARRRPIWLAASIVVAATVVAVVAVRARADAPDRPSGSPLVGRADPADVYSPVAAGERLPDGFFQVVPRDLIAPVYEPVFVPADGVDWPDDADVIGVSIDDEAKAYPVSHLSSREMVVDELAGEPILVTWCPLCGTGVVHSRVVDGEALVFGVQGALFHYAMTWWDHATGSIWSQPLGEAIAGPLTGSRVDLLPSQFTTWGAWRERHPGTLALDAPGVATGFDLDDLFIVVDLTAEARGYPVSTLRQVGVVNDVVAGAELAVVIDPTDADRWAVFSRRVDGRLVELEVDGDVLRDRLSGTTFDPGRGLGLDGPLADGALVALPALVSKPGGGPTGVPIFDAFWPDASVWQPDQSPADR